MGSQANGVSKRSGKGLPQPVWRSNLKNLEVCTYGEVDAEALRDCIDAVTKAGAAIILGVTRDGGAYSVSVLQDDSKMREYPHGTEELNDLLLSLRDHFRAGM